jgi:membrane protein DedA with SNARE-associated domain
VQARGRRAIALLALALGISALAIIATRPAVASSVATTVTHIQAHLGPGLAMTGIYLEETGIPMPVPSEINIGYLGKRVGGNPVGLIAAWLGLTALVVLGATNLFAASRRWGPRLAAGRIGAILHLTPERMQRAQRWFRRWGPLAIVISRYVPGLRWAMAVACGTLGVSYPTFWLSTAIAASVWVGGLLVLGVTIGGSVGDVIAQHPWVILLLPLPASVVIVTAALRTAFVRKSVSDSVVSS